MTDPQAPTAKPEPRLVDLMLRVHRQFATELDLARWDDASPEVLQREIHAAAEAACDAVCRREAITLASEREWLIEAVLDEAFGLGPLEPLFKDPTVETILIQGPRAVLILRDGHLRDSEVVFGSDDHLQHILERNRWKDCVTETHEAGIRTIRFDVRRLREAVARFDAESESRATLSGPTNWLWRLADWFRARL